MQLRLKSEDLSRLSNYFREKLFANIQLSIHKKRKSFFESFASCYVSDGSTYPHLMDLDTLIQIRTCLPPCIWTAYTNRVDFTFPPIFVISPKNCWRNFESWGIPYLSLLCWKQKDCYHVSSSAKPTPKLITEMWKSLFKSRCIHVIYIYIYIKYICKYH